MVVVEAWRQPIRVVVTQSFDANIITIGVEMVVTPTVDVVRKGVLIRSTTKLGSGSSGISIGWKLMGVRDTLNGVY
jgi:hypothetical protein